MKETRNRPVCSRGQWAVHRERCRIADTHIPRLEPEMRLLGEMLPEVMRRLGLDQAAWTARIEADWTTLVGPAVAAHARPGRVHDGVLTVFTDSSVWLYELSRFAQRPLLAKLQAAYGSVNVRAIRFRLDPD